MQHEGTSTLLAKDIVGRLVLKPSMKHPTEEVVTNMPNALTVQAKKGPTMPHKIEGLSTNPRSSRLLVAGREVKAKATLCASGPTTQWGTCTEAMGAGKPGLMLSIIDKRPVKAELPGNATLGLGEGRKEPRADRNMVVDILGHFPIMPGEGASRGDPIATAGNEVDATSRLGAGPPSRLRRALLLITPEGARKKQVGTSEELVKGPSTISLDLRANGTDSLGASGPDSGVRINIKQDVASITK
eukprot:1113048-Alexandrium_andersonii.AAC.1